MTGKSKWSLSPSITAHDKLCQIELILWESYLLSSLIRLLTTQLLWKYKLQSHEKNVWVDRYLHKKDLPTQEELLGKQMRGFTGARHKLSLERWSEMRTSVNNGLKEMNGVQSYKGHWKYHQESTEGDIMVLKNLGFWLYNIYVHIYTHMPKPHSPLKPSPESFSDLIKISSATIPSYPGSIWNQTRCLEL